MSLRTTRAVLLMGLLMLVLAAVSAVTTGAAALVPSTGTGPAVSVPVAKPTTPPEDELLPPPQPSTSAPVRQSRTRERWTIGLTVNFELEESMSYDTTFLRGAGSPAATFVSPHCVDGTQLQTRACLRLCASPGGHPEQNQPRKNKYLYPGRSGLAP